MSKFRSLFLDYNCFQALHCSPFLSHSPTWSQGLDQLKERLLACFCGSGNGTAEIQTEVHNTNCVLVHSAYTHTPVFACVHTVFLKTEGKVIHCPKHFLERCSVQIYHCSFNLTSLS